ncbi:alpha/beta hydrolase family protein [Hyphomonas sp.]|uniref:alpha/beta hydrolase family protein n=1 Tax=Hyphomonas sp. TaxID=87 RepID=UPI00391B84F2
MRTARFWKFMCATALAGTLAQITQADPIPIEDLARLPAMSSVTVSTDGKTMAALIGPTTGNDKDRAVIAAWDLTDLSKPPVIAAPDGKESEFIQVMALKDGKLQVAVRQPFTGRLSGCAEGNAVGTTRTWSVKALLTDTTFKKFDEPFISLGSTRGIGKSTEDCIRITARGSVASRMPQDPENVLISRVGSDFRSELGLLNVRTQVFTPVFKNSRDAGAGYIDTADGEVMSTSGSDEKRNTFEQFTQLKATKGGAFEEHPSLTVDIVKRQEMAVVHRDRETGLYYVVTNKFADKKEIYTYDPVAKKFSETPVFSNPEFDAASVVVSSSPADFGKILGYSYDADVTRYEWLDAEYGGIVLGLEQQLNAETVDIIYRSPDYSLIVFSASGSNMPARYYILRDRSSLELLGAERPWINTEDLSQTGLVYYQARDGRNLPALFTPRQGWKAGEAPGKAVVLPHGGPWARDFGGWDMSGWVPFLTSRGYSVLQPQYRGSVGWGLDLWTAGDSQFGYLAQDDKDDGAAWLVSQGYAAPDKIVMFGYSYGGYAAMAAATRKNSPYQCAIAGAGYAESAKINTGFDRTRFNRMFLKGLSGRDVIKDVANAEIPILIYHGDRDVRVPDTYGKAFYNAVRKHTTAKYVNIPDMPHSLPWTPQQQRLSLKEIESFLTNECGLK